MPSMASRGRVSEGAFASNNGSTRSAQSAAHRPRRRRSSMLTDIWPGFIFCLDLMADGPRWEVSCGVEKLGVVAVHVNAGCPGGQSRKNVLARGGVCVLIHSSEYKQTTTPCQLLHSTATSSTK